MKVRNIDYYIKNFSYTIISNFVSLFISSAVVALLPKTLSVANYGFFQIYLFYSSYVGFFHFGWIDGIYLKYGGINYEDINKIVFCKQYRMLTLFQIMIGIVLVCLSIFFETLDINMMLCLAVCMVITNLKGFCLYVLQLSFRIKEYSVVSIIGRVIYLMLILSIVIFKIDNYYSIIFADIFGNFVSLFFGCYFLKDIIFAPIDKFDFDFKETFSNISVGIKLMLANIANLLIIGIVRWGIQVKWDVEVFARISLTLSVSSLLLTFITAIGSVMFPILRRANQNKLYIYYSCIRDFMSVVLYLSLVLYFPVRYILSIWLPQYSESLKYMALLFPICIYSGKNILLGNSFMNNLRREKALMYINIFTVLLSFIFTITTVFVFENLNLAILSIVILLAFRMFLSEIYIEKILKINFFKENVFETILTIVFMYVGWNFNYLLAFCFYLFIYVIYFMYMFFNEGKRELFKLILKG